MRDSIENDKPHIKFTDVSFSYTEEKENLIFKCNFSIKKATSYITKYFSVGSYLN